MKFLRWVFVLVFVVTCLGDQSYLITDWESLKNAWKNQTIGNTYIKILNDIDVPLGTNDWLKPTSQHSNYLTIECLPGVEINCNAAYSTADRTAMNFLQFRGRWLTLIGGTYQHFNVSGAVIRVDPPCERLNLFDVWFKDVAQTEYAPLRRPVESSFDTVYAQGVGCYHEGCTVTILGGGAEWCGRNSHTWCHIYYLDTDSVTIANTSFRNCGNPFGVSSNKTPLIIYGCDVDDWQLCSHAESKEGDRPSYLFYWVRKTQPAEYVLNNRFSGIAHSYITMDRPLDLSRDILRNDVSEFTTTARFVRTMVDGKWVDITGEEWYQLGCDTQPAE